MIKLKFIKASVRIILFIYTIYSKGWHHNNTTIGTINITLTTAITATTKVMVTLLRKVTVAMIKMITEIRKTITIKKKKDSNNASNTAT